MSFFLNSTFFIILIVLLVILAILYIPIKITLVFTEKDLRLKFANIILLGSKKKDKTNHDETVDTKKQDFEEKKREKSIDYKIFAKKISQLKEAYELEKDEISVFFEHLRNLLGLIHYRITSSFGLEDPADTGMATGAVYAILSSIEAYIRNYVTPKKNSFITVTPDFITPKFKINGEIAVSLTLVKLFRTLQIGKNIYKRNKRKVKIILRGGSMYERSST